MTGSRNILRVFYATVVLNLAVLLSVFVAPRLLFVATHAGEASGALMEQRGAPDMPNMYVGDFTLANRIRAATPPEARLFLPPLNGAHRSIYLVRLYPRKLFWADWPGYEEGLAQPRTEQDYRVTRPDWNAQYCEGVPETVDLRMGGFRLCRREK